MTIGLLPPDPAFAATGRRGGMGLVVRLARWGIARRTGRTFAQPLSGQRAVRRAVLDAALPGWRVRGRLRRGGRPDPGRAGGRLSR